MIAVQAGAAEAGAAPQTEDCMIILPTGAILPANQAAVSPRQQGAAASGFAVPGGSTPAGEVVPASATPMQGASAMLALQELAGRSSDASAGVADREARRHGRELLAALASLQQGLLCGSDPARSLSLLTTLAESAPVAHDPALDGILSAIRLRARLEILRRTTIRSQPAAAQVGPGDHAP